MSNYNSSSYLDLVNSSLKQIQSESSKSNTASINKIKQQLLDSIDTLSFKNNTLELTDNTKYKVQTLTHDLVGIVTSQLGVTPGNEFEIKGCSGKLIIDNN